MNDESAGGRIFFSSTGRSLVDEDEIVVLSVGVDIGSSTSHLVFSRIVLERLDSRYVVTTRETFYESDILLTPYSAEETIDADALGAFIERQYKDAKVDPDEIDTGALILTGVAVRRRNARKIGELFARQAGKMVAVSAGDNLETVMAAYGSGAVARSIRDRTTVMNVDVGGGTSKISICSEGRVIDLTAIDVGARLVCLDAAGQIVRIEEAGRRFASELGIKLELGEPLAPEAARALAARMADRLMDAMAGGSPTAAGLGLLRLDPLAARGADRSDHLLGRRLGIHLRPRSRDVRRSRRAAGAGNPRAGSQAPACRLEPSTEGIRATVIGASQYTTQVSGSTIYVSPMEALPLRNVPVIAPALALDGETIDPAAVAAADQGRAQAPRSRRGRYPGRGVRALARLRHLPAARRFLPRRDRRPRGHPGAKAIRWCWSGDGDVGGLLGIHLREEMHITNAIVSVDGLELKEFDYIDIGTMLPTSGAVPVVIKSLIFPTSAAPGKEWQPAPRALGTPAATPSA